MKNIVIFASGSGSNAENIINYFKNGTKAKVVRVFCNTASAKVFDRCERLGIPCDLINKTHLFSSDEFLQLIREVIAKKAISNFFIWIRF